MARARGRIIDSKTSLIILTVLVILAAMLTLSWMLIRQYASASIVTENSENVVINNVKAPDDLVRTLASEKSGCSQVNGSKNVSYIIRQKDNLAFIHYGCALDAYVFYKKMDTKWKSLSPTNNFYNGIPLCSHLKENTIPSSFQPTCYDVTGTNAPELIANQIN